MTWVTDWVKRLRKHLYTRTSNALSDKRTFSTVYEEVLEWADQLGGCIKKRRLPPGAVLN